MATSLLDELLGGGGASFGNPNIQRQGAKARALAAQRDVNTLPDPRTYAAVSGLLGTAPDEMGFSVLNPQYQAIQQVAEPAFALGTVLGMAPTGGKAAAMTGRAIGPTAAGMTERYMQRQGLMPSLDVYHGTPHTLPPTARNPLGEFDASKIGTGEGAQAYGFGIYTAEAPATAIEYQKKLSSTGSAKNLANQYGGVDKGLEEAKRRVEGYKQLIADGGGGAMSRAKSMLQISEKNVADLEAVKAGIPENTGNLYKVDLPDAMIPKMLDYDKPYSKQHPDVQAALNSIVQSEYTPKLSQIVNPLNKNPMSDSLGLLNEQLGNQQITANYLQQAGIPGIKYLDEGSRIKGEGTRNFVTFPGEEQNLKILERNGLLGTIAP